MNQTLLTTILCALVGVCVACQNAPLPGKPATVHPDPTDDAADDNSDDDSSGKGTRTMDASIKPPPKDAALARPAKDAAPAKPVEIQTPDAAVTGGQVAVQELPLEITVLDVTKDIKRRFGAPHVAVNPKDPNNIVVLASANVGYTKDCVPAPAGSDCEMISVPEIPLLTQPRGFARTPGFMDIGVYVSFDRGKTFEKINTDALVPPGHPEVRARGEGPVAVTPEGHFYIGFNAINWGNWESEPKTFFPNGGVGVIKSTDKGKTWAWTGYSSTPADWPYGGTDATTGTFYVTSGIAGITALGPRSTGLPDSPDGSISDRWISSTNDGVTWTEPQPLGVKQASGHVGANHSSTAAAYGVMATMFLIGDRSTCQSFVGDAATANCVVFQTSKDAGKTWSRHRVPTPSGFAPGSLNLFVVADPAKEGHFAAVLANDTGVDTWVYQTPDAGQTWSEPSKLTEPGNKKHFAHFVAASPSGEFGVMWRTYEGATNLFSTAAPYSVWAAITKDGGKTFSQPLKVSKANSPAEPSDSNDAFRHTGDHGPSGMAMDGAGGVFVVWADWTPGERAIFFASVNVKAFKF